METALMEDGLAESGRIDIEEILRRFAAQGPLPVEAIEAARARREECAPVFLRIIEEAIAGQATADDAESPIFFIFHLLGEWREKAACGPLLRLLQCEPERLEYWFGDALTETVGRVMAGVFDGDPAPLRRAILNPEANEWARDALFETLAELARTGAVDRDETALFLRDCFVELSPQAEHHVWVGWLDAVARLGLGDLRSLVRKAFKRGFVDPMHMDYDDFRKDLNWAVRTRDEPAPPLRVFGDTIDELGRWHAFAGEEEDKWRRGGRFEDDDGYWEGLAATRLVEMISRAPAANPNRNVGRNDPCPCGSGRKFKKCCLP